MQKYRQHSTHPRINAQRNLCDRSHYADPDTLRFFGTRILSAHHAADGLLFIIVESQARDYDTSERGFRYRIFDIAGYIIDHAGSNDFYPSSKAARRACQEHLATLDPIAITRAAIDQLERNYSAEIADMRAAILYAVKQRGKMEQPK